MELLYAFFLLLDTSFVVLQEFHLLPQHSLVLLPLSYFSHHAALMPLWYAFSYLQQPRFRAK